MNIKTSIILIFLLTLGFVNSKAFSQKKTKYKVYKHISEINSDSPDTCYVSAYVTFVYICPPCPPPNQCKPCIENHFTITDDPKEVHKFIKVDDDTPENYSKGKKYTFLIKLIKTSEKEVRYAKLIKEKK